MGFLKWEGPSSDFIRQGAGGGEVGVLAVVFGLVRCIFMTVFKHTSSGFTVLTDRSGVKHPSVETSRPTAAVQRGKASSNPARLSDGSPQPEKGEGPVDEPWVSARRTRARRC